MPAADLVPRTEAHARALLPLILGTPVADTLLWDGPSSAEEFLSSYPASRGPSSHRHYTIVESSSGEAVGALSIRPGEAPARGDLGYWIGIPFQGRGLGTAAVGRALEIAFGEMGMEKVDASTFAGNGASRRVLEKNGFRLEGTVRKAHLKRGTWRDDWLLGITREDWERRG